jgi:hypothetical protein
VEASVADPMTTYFCKQPGCENESRSRVGRYSYCPEHQGQAKAAARPPGEQTTEQRIKSLASLARSVDKAKQKATTLTKQALRAKLDADELEQSFKDHAREILGNETRA